MRVGDLLFAGNSLAKAQRIFFIRSGQGRGCRSGNEHGRCRSGLHHDDSSAINVKPLLGPSLPEGQGSSNAPSPDNADQRRAEGQDDDAQDDCG